MLIAITRQVSPNINQCELTYIERQTVDIEVAREQHAKYEQALRSLGVQVHSLPSEPDLPDSVFVEDVALILDECAVMLNPGAASRELEVATVEKTLALYREIFHILPPDTLDGGDILRVGRIVYIGLSERSTEGAVEQIKAILEPRQYQVRTVRVGECLHLKSAITQVSSRDLLVNPKWVSKDDFIDMRFIDVDSSEPHAANALLVRDTIIYSSSFPKTQRKLQVAGIRMVVVDASELAKAEGGVTCCSLLFAA